MKKNICAIICLNVVLFHGFACAHPESGFLPDAIAETEYRIVIDLDPEDIETRIRLGMVLYRKNKLQEALEQYEEVLKRNSESFDAHDGIGLVMLKQDRYDEAVERFKQAIAINNKDPKVYYHLGQAYRAAGHMEKAVLEYRKSLGLQKDETISEELMQLEKTLERSP